MRVTTGQVEVSGLRLAYERAGGGPPLVLLHGILGDRRLWRRQLASLSDRFTVVAWDAPGCGGSDDPPPSFRLPEYADCLAGLIGALGLGRPHVAGVSWGGGLALELHRRHPGLPRSLVLASSYAGWAGSLPPDAVRQRLERALADAARPPAEVARAFVPDVLGPSPPPELRAEVAAVTEGFHPAGYRAMARAFAEADLREALPRVGVPVLLLHGDADRRSPPAIGEGLRRGIPGARLVVVAGGGHLLNVDVPERFDAEVRRFLAGVEAGEAGGR